MANQDISHSLKSYGLNLLSAVIEKSTKASDVMKKVKTDAEIDLTSEITEENVEKLKEFENVNQQYLIQLLIDGEIKNNASHRMKLDWVILGFAFAYLFSITFFPLTEMGYRVADTILGVVIGVLIGSVMGYWYDGTPNKD